MEGEAGGCDWGCAAVARAKFYLMRDLERPLQNWKELGEILLDMYVRPPPPLPFRGEFYLVLDDQAPRPYIHMQKPDDALLYSNIYKHGQSSRCSLCS